MNYCQLQKLKLELAVKAKKGTDFILAASVIWFAIAYIWSLQATSYNKSVLVFMVGALLLPLAYVFSKLLNTQWKVPKNPLQSLGLWLNFAQLFYFPFLVFILLTLPDYFVMVYAIITGAHLFPYTWFYDDNTYAIMAGIISATSLIMGLNFPSEYMFYIPLYTGFLLLVMFVVLWFSMNRAVCKLEEHIKNTADRS